MTTDQQAPDSSSSSALPNYWSKLIDYNKSVITLGAGLLAVSVTLAFPQLNNAAIVVPSWLKFLVGAAWASLAIATITACMAIALAGAYLRYRSRDIPPGKRSETDTKLEEEMARSRKWAARFSNYTHLAIIIGIGLVASVGISVLMTLGSTSQPTIYQALPDVLMAVQNSTTASTDKWQVKSLTLTNNGYDSVVTNLTTGQVFSVTLNTRNNFIAFEPLTPTPTP